MTGGSVSGAPTTSVRTARRLVPVLLLAVAVVAAGLSAAPWLRSFPASVGAPPLLGAAVVGVLLPSVVVPWLRAGRGRRWWPVAPALDVLGLVVYLLVVVLRAPTDLAGLGHGLVQGPSQLLTFALPLVSPRTLLVAPTVLVWVVGAVTGECLARRWTTALPQAALLVGFGLAYAATERAATGEPGAVRGREALLAGGLLACLLLLRAGQSWLRQELTAEATQPDGVLPLRGLGTGAGIAALVAAAAALAVQGSAFPVRAHAPQRMPVLDHARTLSPLGFVAGLRPGLPSQAQPLFRVRLDRPGAAYISIADLDRYDGAGWSFRRTFRPSGGVLPADTDAALRAGVTVRQQYSIDAGPMTSSPWLPFLARPRSVAGLPVAIDPSSGMVVPAVGLTARTSFTVVSTVPTRTFTELAAAAVTPDAGTSALDVTVPAELRDTLDRIVRRYAVRTGVPTTHAVALLQTIAASLRRDSTLSAAARGSATDVVGPGVPPGTATGGAPSTPPTTTAPTPTSTATPTPTATPRRSPAHHTTPAHHATPSHHTTPTHHATPTHHTTPTPSATPTAPTGAGTQSAGSTGFSDVLGSVLGPDRAGTPEQFATLVALVARDLGIPARVATGFRLPADGDGSAAGAARQVTTAQAWTWVEVPVVGRGWLVLDASPTTYASSPAPTRSAAPASPTASPSSVPNALITPAAGGHGIERPSPVVADSRRSTGLLLPLVQGGVGLVVLAGLVLIAARKPLRARRRRRVPDPDRRVVGAWREGIDRLSEAGLPDLTARTSREIVALVQARFGEVPALSADRLAHRADAVTFGGVTLQDTPDEADAAWREVRVLRRALRRQLTPRERIGAAWHYRRSGPVRARRRRSRSH